MVPRRKQSSRRAFLRNALCSAGAAVPFLASFEAAAQRGVEPTRYLFFRHPNGVVRSAWLPTSPPGAPLRLGPTMRPLDPFRERLVVIDGLKQEAAIRSDGAGGSHHKGMVTLLTGAWGNGGRHHGVSLDQLLASRIGKDTRFPSLQLGVKPNAGAVSTISARAAGAHLSPEGSPQKTFDRLFGGGINGTGADLERLRATRRSVLDVVRREVEGIRNRVGAERAQHLEGHLDAIRNIEKRLAAPGGTCGAPGAPGALDPAANDNFPKISRLQLDLLATALACDLTRVASFCWGWYVDQTRFTWLGINEAYHDPLSHAADNNLDARTKLERIELWFAEEMARFIARLAETSAASLDGTLLDHVLVTWSSDVAKGNNHSWLDMPFLLIGRAGGKLATGRHLRFDKVLHNQLLVSIANLAGAGIDKMGNLGSGPLPGLV